MISYMTVPPDARAVAKAKVNDATKMLRHMNTSNKKWKTTLQIERPIRYRKKARQIATC